MVELKHHGVKGMRRDIRHFSEEFGVRTKILKGGNAVGEHTKNTISKYKKEIRDATKEQRGMNIKARDKWLETPTPLNPLKFKGKIKDIQARKERKKRTKSYKTTSKEHMKTANKIAKKYRSEFTISLMKDLSVRKIQKGAGITNEPVLTSRKISDVFAGYGYDEEN